MTTSSSESGFTLVEVLMVVVLISVLAVASLQLFGDSDQDARYQETLSRMARVREALIGNPDLKVDGARTSFGFLGDIGALPQDDSGLGALLDNSGGYPPYSMDSGAHAGAGWNGPYLGSGDASSLLVNDGWGRPLQYTVSWPFSATLTSYGKDGAPGAPGGTVYDQDIVITIPESMTSAMVYGFVCQNSGPFNADADVELGFPDGKGSLMRPSLRVSAGQNGQFQFKGVPFGIHSISVYVPDKSIGTPTKGPGMIIVDKPNVVVPCSLLDVGGS